MKLQNTESKERALKFILILWNVVYLYKIYLFKGNGRNRNLSVMVCQTESECDLNAGAVCATYPGPSTSSTSVVVLDCGGTLDGKFLRVHQQVATGSFLHVCECVVYSH